IRGESASPAADLFAFGLVLYEMAEGKLPGGGSLGSALAFGPSIRLPVLTRKDLPRELHSIIERLLDPNPEKRSSLPRHAIAALAGLHDRRRFDWRIIAAALAVTLAVFVGLRWRSRLEPKPPEVVWESLIDFPDSVHSPAFSKDGKRLAFVRG